MYKLRLLSVTYSRFYMALYNCLEKVLIYFYPILNRIDSNCVQKLFVISEKIVKGPLFDCQMCGQCMLSSSGMSCPMNCPKNLRNGPCGGVRANGRCEIKPDMRCVWMEAWRGARMQNKEAIDKLNVVQGAVDNRLKNTSSWLHAVKQKLQ